MCFRSLFHAVSHSDFPGLLLSSCHGRCKTERFSGHVRPMEPALWFSLKNSDPLVSKKSRKLGNLWKSLFFYCTWHVSMGKNIKLGNRDRSQDETGGSSQLEAHELQNHGDLSKRQSPKINMDFVDLWSVWFNQFQQSFKKKHKHAGGWPTPLKSHMESHGHMVVVSTSFQHHASHMGYGIITSSPTANLSPSTLPPQADLGCDTFDGFAVFAWFPTMGYRVPRLIVGNPIYKWMSCWGTLMDWKLPYV